MSELTMKPKEWMEQVEKLRNQIGEVIVGQEEVVEQMLWCIFAGGHALLEGIPGLGKTMLVSTVSKALDLSFSRIQFTPDLMPSDITGTNILSFGQQGSTGMSFQKGPLFSSIVLADEINRATPKTQSALLEAMQEKTVTVGSQTHQLPRPFFVLATQNPLENEGTYPLPEAQLDRFLLKIEVSYPSADELKEIVKRTTSSREIGVEKQMTAEELLEIQQGAKEILVADEVLDYAVRLLMMTHPEEETAPDGVRRYVRFGSGPRGVQAIISIGKVRALFSGRMHLSTGDIRAAALPALRHRIFLNFEGQAMGVTTDQVIREVMDQLERTV
ncbi:AAA family ATPase [Paenibacillus lemnae]|uniref:MoxR family ATPase n=1 Tax=Paenibacillus lemnae TaxID=1330551 RepID=A0A848M441_PAELE|nr:MoxR family ATPase [Paenibacillus lemnae]NMO95808.1 MoxR family ATPase [Paenibacillus lemnae]